MVHRFGKITSFLAAAGVGVSVVLLHVAPASADETYPVGYTDIGIYRRAAPSMDSARVGSALSNGTPVLIDCETTGQVVDNGFAPTGIWEKLSDGTYLPNAFLYTGVDGWTPGISRCDGGAASQPQPMSDDHWVPYCGPSEFLTEISVDRWANGDFKIVATPNEAARTALSAYAATVSQWHAIQDCVSGLRGALADSIWDQLHCHQQFALAPAISEGRLAWLTGPSYDLESWRGTFSEADWIATLCGTTLNTEQDHPEPPVWSGSPDAGVTDLSYPDNIG